MKKLDIDYSLKNIPIPSCESCLIKLIVKIESVVKRMRRRAHLFLREKHESGMQKEDFGLVEPFKKEFLDMIPNIKFHDTNVDP